MGLTGGIDLEDEKNQRNKKMNFKWKSSVSKYQDFKHVLPVAALGFKAHLHA